MVERIRLLLKTPGNERLPATEVLRRATEWGYTGGRSQMTELVKRLRPKPRQEPIVRFEGLPREYTQFDFGECLVEFGATGKQRVQFFTARLKYSRFMHVIVVPDQIAETLVRSLIACLVAFGGSTKEWVFDNPRTVRISPIGAKPVVLHRFLRQLVAEHVAHRFATCPGAEGVSIVGPAGLIQESLEHASLSSSLLDIEAEEEALRYRQAR
jgi:transposase